MDRTSKILIISAILMGVIMIGSLILLLSTYTPPTPPKHPPISITPKPALNLMQRKAIDCLLPGRQFFCIWDNVTGR